VDLFVNDLSLHGQFGDQQAFRRSLDEVIKCRDCATNYRRTLRVPRSIVGRRVVGQADFRQVVQTAGDRNFVSLVISWIAKNGPFVEDDLVRNPNEYLALSNDTVVTEEAIGEAAARHFQGLPAGLVSFIPSQYDYTPLEVYWHRDHGDTDLAELPNYWSSQELDHYLRDLQEAPTTWDAFIAQLPGRFPNLTFLPNLAEHLAGEPFVPYVVERSFALLGVLNELKSCFDADGRRTVRGKELMENYFQHGKARFSDSSDSEKNDARFRTAMTFRDPLGQPMECFWHGKIQTPPYRIHFSYPIERDAPLYIAYIGQKLTKK
jgi:hypothetical protein